MTPVQWILDFYTHIRAQQSRKEQIDKENSPINCFSQLLLAIKNVENMFQVHPWPFYANLQRTNSNKAHKKIDYNSAFIH